jgi:hypothetical protein
MDIGRQLRIHPLTPDATNLHAPKTVVSKQGPFPQVATAQDGLPEWKSSTGKLSLPHVS